MQHNKQSKLKPLLITALLALTLSLILICHASAEIYAFSGNSTIVKRTGFPIIIERDQIMPGETWTYIYNLEEGHRYHIFLVGEYVNLEDHITDYDIHLYRARGPVLNYLSSHTEAAGYPEQVSNDEEGWYFTPESTGTYYICVRNDPKDGVGSEPATLMVIESIDPDIFYRIDMEEPRDDYVVPESSYAFEFITDQPRITVDVTVSNRLDMYEARLYPMANPAKDIGYEIRGLIAPWSPGLLGMRKDGYGGFNNNPQGYRKYESSDSCEIYGEDMLIDYDSNSSDQILYYLVLMAEKGSGRVTFVLRTDFTPPNITLVNSPDFITSDEPLFLRSTITDESEIDSINFYMSTDGRVTWDTLDYSYSDGYYTVEVPPLDKGTILDYRWTATDSLGNTGEKIGQAKAMNPTDIRLVVEPDQIYGGEGVITKGTIGLPYVDLTLNYTRGDKVTQFNVTADDDGDFTHTFISNQIGEWSVSAQFLGDSVNWPSSSNNTGFMVRRKPTTLSLNLSRSWIGLGDYVNVTGQFSEQRIGYEVFIAARNGLNETSMFALTDDNGSYRTVFQPETMGEWTLYAEVAADGIYTEAATSLPETLTVGNPTLAYRYVDFTQNALKPPYVYGVGTFLGASIGGTLVFARRKGWLKNPLNRGEAVVEEPQVEVDEEEDEYDFDF